MKFAITLIFCILLFSGFCYAQKSPAAQFAQTASPVELTTKLKELVRRKNAAEQLKTNLRVKYTEEYVEVKKVNSEIERIEKEIAATSGELEKAIVEMKEASDLISSIGFLRQRLQLCNLSKTGEECRSGKIQRDLNVVYEKAIKNPAVLNILFTNTFEKKGGENGETEAVFTAEQNAELLRTIIQQNQQIIRLLERSINR